MPNALVGDRIKFSQARAWQREILIENSDEEDRNIIGIMDRYVNELRFRLHFNDPYMDDFHRVSQLRRILHDLGPIYDGFAERAANVNVLPDAAQSFLDSINRMSLDVFTTMKRVERQILAEHKRF